jgi:hypothetical protein
MLAPKSKTKEPVPKASDLLSQNKGGSQVGVGSKNYISENRNRAIHELHPPHLKEASNAAATALSKESSDLLAASLAAANQDHLLKAA